MCRLYCFALLSGFQGLPKPPKVGKIMAQHFKKAIILHTLGVQVVLSGLQVLTLGIAWQCCCS